MWEKEKKNAGKEVFLENNIGKGENAGNQHFLLFFPHCFQKASLPESLIAGIVCKKVKKNKLCDPSVFQEHQSQEL